MRLFLIATIAFGLTTSAAAQDAQEGAAEPPRAPPYLIKVAEGIRLAVNGNHQGAMRILEEAKGEDPSRPEAYFHAGAVERIRGNLTEALQQFRDCARTAAGRDDVVHARCLHGIAETLERQENGLEQAREAWQEYQRFSDTHEMAADPQMARARIQRLDVTIEQERVYVDVRQRIADRERQNASGGSRNNNRNRNR